MNKFFHFAAQRYLNISFFIVNFVIFAIAILMRFFDQQTNKISLGILLVLLECFSFYLLIKIFQNLQKQTQEDIERASLYHQKEIQEEHLLAMMQADQDIDKLSKQLEEMQKNAVDTIDPQFQKEMDNLFISYCPNKIIDAILYHKSFLMKKQHINYYVKASVKDDLNIEDFAILSVLNNMIDNAMEACLQSKAAKPYVEVRIFTKANYLVIQVENSVNEDFKMIIGKSSKADDREHGLGLEIIQQQCKKHYGTFEHEYDADEKAVICTATMRL